jgi:glycosyltransferase involved in cell wall biosynthesis
MTPDPRVMWLMTRLNVGGPARQAAVLTKALGARNYRVELLVGSEAPSEGKLDDGLDAQLVPGLGRPVSPLRDLRAARFLMRRLRDRPVDVVHTHTAKAGALGRLAAHRAKVPVVIHTFHGHVLEGYFSAPVARTITAVERRLATWTDALVAVSPEIRDELLSLGVGKPEQWRVIPLGLDLDQLLAPGPTKQEARALLGLPQEGHIVGSVGRLVPIKDIECFLEAAASVARDRSDVTFVVAGDGELRTALEERGEALLGERVRFLGWVFDLPALYAALDVVVLTSRNEGTPTALIEAGAAGRPVVATSVGGVPAVVEDAVTGILVPPGDPRAVAAAVLELLADEDLGRSLGESGRRLVHGRFGADRLIDDIDLLYAELLERKRQGGVVHGKRR